jgi:alpha-beta hydrolase superfamily lysophospholipase
MLSTLSTADGLKLHVKHSPAGDRGRGTVVLVHGLGEHSGRYAHVVKALNGWGWHTVAYDHRGHGRSEGARGALNDPDAMLADLSLVVAAARAEHVGPLVLLGHSMGGLVVARYGAEGTLHDPERWFHPVDAIVMSSPALDAGLSGGQRFQLRMMRWLAPNLAVGNGLKPEWVSRDPEVVKAYVADPLVHDRITPKLVSFIVDGGEFARRQASAWNVPTLLVYAGKDRCVAPRGSRDFASAAPAHLVETREFPALYHEIFNEPEQQEVLAALEAWLATRSSRVADLSSVR